MSNQPFPLTSAQKDLTNTQTSLTLWLETDGFLWAMVGLWTEIAYSNFCPISNACKPIYIYIGLGRMMRKSQSISPSSPSQVLHKFQLPPHHVCSACSPNIVNITMAPFFLPVFPSFSQGFANFTIHPPSFWEFLWLRWLRCPVIMVYWCLLIRGILLQ